MPQFERRLYDPSDDARFFEGGDDELEEGSRLPLLIVIALVVLASFAGVVWLAYTQGVQRGREDAPRIIAEQNRIVVPTNPYAQLQIYKQRKRQEDIALNEPVPTPSANAHPRPTSSIPTSPPKALAPSVPVTASHQDGTAMPQNRATQKSSVSSSSVGPRTGASALSPRANSVPFRSSVQAAPVIPKGAASASVAPKAQTEASSPSDPTPVPHALVPQGGEFMLQVGSYASEAEANSSWQTYRGAHSSIASYTSDVQKADLGAKGTWYRLRIGPFATTADAIAACAKLKAQGGSCFLARR